MWRELGSAQEIIENNIYCLYYRLSPTLVQVGRFCNKNLSLETFSYFSVVHSGNNKLSPLLFSFFLAISYIRKTRYLRFSFISVFNQKA